MGKVALNAAELVLRPRVVAGAPVPTTLAVWAASSQCGRQVQLAIVEVQDAPHRRFSRSLVEIVVLRHDVERVARRVVSVLHHVHQSLESGATLRLRKSGAFASVWNVDVLRAGSPRCSWPVPQKSADHLDRLDLEVQRHVAEPGMSAQMAALSEHLTEIAGDLTRDRQVDDLIRRNVEMPIEELLAILGTRGLLTP